MDIEMSDDYAAKRQRLIDKISARLDHYRKDCTFQKTISEIARLTEWMILNKESTTLADLASVTDQIDRMMQADSQWATLSSLHTSRAYQFGALSYFHETRIRKYQVA